MNVTENVVDLVVDKIQKLSELGQSTISLAACIGNRFDIETLSIISQQIESTISEIIWETIREGFVNPLGKWQKIYMKS